MLRGFARYATAGRFWQILLQSGFKSVGISLSDGRDIPKVTPTIAPLANLDLMPSLRKICRIW
jgi:hypothetical protein